MGALVFFGTLFILVIANLPSRRRYRSYNRYHSGGYHPYDDYDDFDYRYRERDQTSAVLNTILFIALLFIALALYSKENKSTSNVNYDTTEQVSKSQWASK